jgi:thiamine pyrophosphate-dependent acetolactate synthase large subunit-like protein
MLVGMVHQVLEGVIQRVSTFQLNKRIKTTLPPRPTHDQQQQEDGYCHPTNLLTQLSSMLDPSAVVVLDVGDVAVWAALHLTLSHNQRVLTTSRMGTMGYCIPAMIATKLTRPYATVVGIAGDGGVQMNIGELSTAAQHNLSLVLIILQNGVLGSITEAKHKKSIKITNPDYTALARAYGGDGAVIYSFSNEQIHKVLKTAFSHKGLFIVTVMVDPKLRAPTAKWGEETPMTAEHKVSSLQAQM